MRRITHSQISHVFTNASFPMQVPGHGPHLYVINPHYFAPHALSPFPTSFSADSQLMDAWLAAQGARLDGEWCCLPARLQSGHAVRLLALWSQGDIDLMPSREGRQGEGGGGGDGEGEGEVEGGGIGLAVGKWEDEESDENDFEDGEREGSRKGVSWKSKRRRKVDGGASDVDGRKVDGFPWLRVRVRRREVWAGHVVADLWEEHGRSSEGGNGGEGELRNEEDEEWRGEGGEAGVQDDEAGRMVGGEARGLRERVEVHDDGGMQDDSAVVSGSGKLRGYGKRELRWGEETVMEGHVSRADAAAVSPASKRGPASAAAASGREERGVGGDTRGREHGMAEVAPSTSTGWQADEVLRSDEGRGEGEGVCMSVDGEATEIFRVRIQASDDEAMDMSEDTGRKQIGRDTGRGGGGGGCKEGDIWQPSLTLVQLCAAVSVAVKQRGSSGLLASLLPSSLPPILTAAAGLLSPVDLHVPCSAAPAVTQSATDLAVPVNASDIQSLAGTVLLRRDTASCFLDGASIVFVPPSKAGVLVLPFVVRRHGHASPPCLSLSPQVFASSLSSPDSSQMPSPLL